MKGMHDLWRLALVCAIVSPSLGDSREIHTLIRNKMEDGSNITVKCYTLHECCSNDVDSGLHAVEAGHYFEFSFHPNTLFVPYVLKCSALSRYGRSRWLAYQDGDRYPKMCLDGCDWSVTKDGVVAVDHGVPLKVECGATDGLVVAAARCSTCSYVLAATLFILVILLPGFNLCT